MKASIFDTIMPRYLEPFVWIAALAALFFLDVSAALPSFCLFRCMGIEWCPGCGIGHAIHYALHLQFSQSFHEHWFGIPATIILLHRIFKAFYTIKTVNYGCQPNAYDAAGPTAC